MKVTVDLDVEHINIIEEALGYSCYGDEYNVADAIVDLIEYVGDNI